MIDTDMQQVYTEQNQVRTHKTIRWVSISLLVGVLGLIGISRSCSINKTESFERIEQQREETKRLKTLASNECLENHSLEECVVLLYPEKKIANEAFKNCLSEKTFPTETFVEECKKSAIQIADQ